MSQPLPTARVRNPAAPDTYMVVNLSELREDHDLWHEQAEGFMEPVRALPPIDPREADVAVRVLGRLVAQRLGIADADWAALPVEDRLAAFLDVELEANGTVPPDFRVAKGPGGRWYVFRGPERVSSAFASEADAAAEMARLLAA